MLSMQRMITCMHIQLYVLYKENSGAANICTYKLDDPAIAPMESGSGLVLSI